MVLVILQGGLGNQLFQYATGRAHSLRTDSDLYIDISRFDRAHGPDVAKRSLYLDAFNLTVKYVKESSICELDRTIVKQISRAVAKVSPQLATRLFNLYVEKRSLKFDPRVTELPGDVMLEGYWQSELYFNDFDETLRHELSVRNPVRGKNRWWYKRIVDTDSVSVHVRRGDYVALEWALPPAYYRNALNFIHRETEATNLFFFSDDMDWVRTHSQELLPDCSNFNVNYVECNDGETAHEDLRLMRTCDHHVVANSSFSWWGAWLDESKTKQIVAPNHWVHDSVDRLDIVPDRWTTVG
jgi:hypothetical protein